MVESLEIVVYADQKLVYSRPLDATIVLGRQSPKDSQTALYSEQLQGDRVRLVIAEASDTGVSREQVRLEALEQDRVRITNLGKKTLSLKDANNAETSLARDQSRETDVPITFFLGNKVFRIQKVQLTTEVHTLDVPSVAEPSVPDSSEIKTCLPWFQQLLTVFQSATRSSEFFDQAAHALVHLLRMDTGRVLVGGEHDWTLKAHKTAGPRVEEDWQPSRHVLAQVYRNKKTVWEVPRDTAAKSLEQVQAVVAAPILSPQNEVIGALYGDRRGQPQGTAVPRITELDAVLVQLLASGVAAGLARVQQQEAAFRARERFEQFFTPQLSQMLEENPDLLKGRESDISVLFCDIRAFSRISKNLGPEQTFKWIGDVMGSLSECVRDEEGVLVDYIGDELMAMWGAPQQQPDHAIRSCRAALAMLKRLPELNERWHKQIKEEIRIGIGINSGPAQVGNTGSDLKYKYGPLGHTVNLASRVQGATKYLKTPFLVTQSTQSQLGDAFATRRVCKVRVVNIDEPVELYEIRSPDQPADWQAFRRGYEESLQFFEKQDFGEAAKIIGELIQRYGRDPSALLLLARAAQHLVEEVEKFDPAWELPGK